MNHQELVQILGHTFRDPELLTCALRHASTTDRRTASNERLEFLGDRVLGLVIAEMLYMRFPDEPEGHLARRFTALVSGDALVRIAGEIGLSRFIDMATADADAGGRDNTALHANAMEAVLGALYLDGGIDAPKRVIGAFWAPLIDEDKAPPKDPKTALQEWAQAHKIALPVYREISRSGPDHAPRFTMEVAVKGAAPARAEGVSKRLAEREAAQGLLDRLKD
ncbi:ribonuclease III [Varunaivibrio sulfuroxidans]|uniref:Ribonuclease 3 n=1 Tax=Varunaivibrio sulfuroxidans TaxID=1773489 RepID=A0A4R3JDU2_9PROT|nr:ribonuclease III [Varunaivibrio sulfuroxidans]TCS64229.1 RNAse III [Varunaivibrio sulfuroxidans]WES31330.1 ribonuclease III [Varunaivibrio sulfuroxidans]